MSAPGSDAGAHRAARRSLLRGIAAAGLLALAGPAVAVAEGAAAPVIVVSRKRILEETIAGRTVLEMERSMGSAFQARVDEAQRLLKEEEEELARVRGTLPREEFDRRAEAFDRRVRTARRLSQRQAAEMQQAFREARDTLSAALGPILIELLKAEGASIVLDSGQILVAAPSVNKTDEVIALFDAQVPAPEIALPEPEPLIVEDDDPSQD